MRFCSLQHFCRSCAISLAFCLVLCSPKAVAQQFATPSDVQLKVHVKNDQGTFYIGQIIPIELIFTSSTPKAYQLDMANYDRSGRMSIEQFRVEPPTGWVDPIGSYLGGIGGGIRGFQM